MIQPLDLVIGEPIYHSVAVCRWCAGRFVQVYGAQWLCLNPECASKQIALAMDMPDDYDGPLRTESPYCYLPTPAQCELEGSRAKNLLFGGAASGTKSHGLRWQMYRWCRDVAGYESLLIRRTFPQLDMTHLRRMLEECKIFGARMTGNPKRNMEWQNGSFILAGHCETEKDMERYLSTEYDHVTIDEASTVAQKAVREISSRARSKATLPAVRARGGGWARLGSNPGGESHVYLHDVYISKDPDPEMFKRYHPEHYDFIQARVADNPYGEEDYEETRLDALDEDRRRQLADGDWSSFEGQFFRRFDAEIHVTKIEPE